MPKDRFSLRPKAGIGRSGRGTAILILYVAPKYDYGKPEWGLGYEHHNFYESLRALGHDIIYFDFPTLARRHGRRWTNESIRELAREHQPDLLFSVIFGDTLRRSTLRSITQESETVTVNWFCDDEFRFRSFSRFWAPSFDAVVTTTPPAIAKYKAAGYHNAILSQWGFNHLLYRPPGGPPEHDVTFVGQPISSRRDFVDRLRARGIKIQVWGKGWPDGPLTQDQMIQCFGRSRINLNFTGLSTPALPTWAGRLDRGWVRGLLNRVPFASNAKSRARQFLALAKRRKPNRNVVDGLNGPIPDYGRGIQARIFEITGCGGFLLSQSVEGLDKYFVAGKEIAVFDGESELAEKISYYLAGTAERVSIAQAGHDRALREHTYAHRFTEIFNKVRLPTPSVKETLGRAVPIGTTREIL